MYIVVYILCKPHLFIDFFFSYIILRYRFVISRHVWIGRNILTDVIRRVHLVITQDMFICSNDGMIITQPDAFSLHPVPTLESLI